MTRAEFLAQIDEAGASEQLSVTVSVYFADTEFSDLTDFEDSLSDFVETEGIGEWIGSGKGDLGEGAFFDVTYLVQSIPDAVQRLRLRLKELGAGSRTQLEASDGKVFDLYGKGSG